jgi:hypothetical protein
MQIRVWRPGACRYVDLLSYFFPYTVWLIKKIIKIIWICVFFFCCCLLFFSRGHARHVRIESAKK